MPLILFQDADERSDAGVCFLEAPNGAPWDEVFEGRWDDLTKRYDLVLSIDGGQALPENCCDNFNLALCCSSLSVFANHMLRATTFDVIFAPGALDYLDNQRLHRETLVVATDLTQGSVLTPELISTETGGTGVSAERLDLFVGTRLAYDMVSRQPLDFGHIL